MNAKYFNLLLTLCFTEAYVQSCEYIIIRKSTITNITRETKGKKVVTMIAYKTLPKAQRKQ